MKAERRHELQQNTLAKVIIGAPSWWQQWGGRSLLIAVAVLAVSLLINYRITSTRANTARAAEAVSAARDNIIQLQNSSQYNMPPAAIASQRNRLFNDTSAILEETARLPVSKSLLAENYLAQGDLNWTLANLSELPGAATQPSLQLPRDPQQLLKGAREAYQTVLDKYPDQQQAVIAARFGLAAIAENMGEWDAAQTQYNTVAQIPNVPQAYLTLAKFRLDRLPEIRQMPRIAEPASMPTAAMPAPLPTGIAAPAPTTAPTIAMSTTKPAATTPVMPPAPSKPPTSAPKPIPTSAATKP
jgi:hypothetical protein